MSSYEILNTIVSAIGILIALLSFAIALLSYFKASRASEEATKASMAATEISLRALIEQRRSELLDISMKIAPLQAKEGELADTERKHLDILQQTFDAAVESWHNAYEEACAKYLDNKIDKIRFRKMFDSEIRSLIQKDTKEIFHSEKSKFQAILTVYREWFILEK